MKKKQWWIKNLNNSKLWTSLQCYEFKSIVEFADGETCRCLVDLKFVLLFSPMSVIFDGTQPQNPEIARKPTAQISHMIWKNRFGIDTKTFFLICLVRHDTFYVQVRNSASTQLFTVDFQNKTSCLKSSNKNTNTQTVTQNPTRSSNFWIHLFTCSYRFVLHNSKRSQKYI